ncbi:Crp/Fnr family transcriptional regulator [bacterium]|nr:Crp/Fnr family transcriptional regulator [bacterium]
MSKELTGSIAARMTSPHDLAVTIVRLAADSLSFESPEPFSPRTRVRLEVRLGADRAPTQMDVEILSSEDADGACLCDGKIVDIAPEVRRKIVTFVDDLVREEYLKEFPAGTEVFKEGENSRHIYYIAVGQFVVDVGGEKVAEVTEEDQFLGEISFLLGTPRSATVTAMTDSLLMAIPAEVFQKTLAENPRFGVELARLLAKRLTQTTQNYAQKLHHI